MHKGWFSRHVYIHTRTVTHIEFSCYYRSKENSFKTYVASISPIRKLSDRLYYTRRLFFSAYISSRIRSEVDGFVGTGCAMTKLCSTNQFSGNRSLARVCQCRTSMQDERMFLRASSCTFIRTDKSIVFVVSNSFHLRTDFVIVVERRWQCCWHHHRHMILRWHELLASKSSYLSSLIFTEILLHPIPAPDGRIKPWTAVSAVLCLENVRVFARCQRRDPLERVSVWTKRWRKRIRFNRITNWVGAQNMCVSMFNEKNFERYVSKTPCLRMTGFACFSLRMSYLDE